MLSEFLETLFKLNKSATKVELTPVEYRRVVLSKGDTIEHIALNPPPRDDVVSNVHSLLSMIDVMGSTETMVYVSGGCICVIVNDDRRSDRFSLRFSESPAMWALRKLMEGVNHRELIKILSTELVDAVDPSFRIAVSRIDWTLSEQQDGTASTMGKAIAQKAHASDAPIPEYVQVRIPVYDILDQSTVQDIRCSVFVDFATRTIQCLPVDGIDHWLRMCQSEIAGSLDNRVGNEVKAVVAGWPEDLSFTPGSPHD